MKHLIRSAGTGSHIEAKALESIRPEFEIWPSMEQLCVALVICWPPNEVKSVVTL